MLVRLRGLGYGCGLAVRFVGDSHVLVYDMNDFIMQEQQTAQATAKSPAKIYCQCPAFIG